MPEAQTEMDGFEVLIFCSDQHTAGVAGFMGDRIARTPHLDAIASRGIVFENAYTSCPLCAPARASFMTARVPSRIGMFNNSCDFRSSEVTFAHLHAMKGYDSVLIGRMHFNGMDFFHGFTKRVSKDITGSYWGFSAENRADLKNYARSMRQESCLELLGSGDTPVREYDRRVVANAMEYLAHDYERPQLMVVGTYGPHFPYVADGARMEKYREALRGVYRESRPDFTVPPLLNRVQKASAEDIIELRAAYYALVEEMDDEVGQVYLAFQKYLVRRGRPGIFIYMSDHGDQLGYKGLYGKQTFFERSVKIPLVFSMSGVGPRRVRESVSIMDVGPTLCSLNGTENYPDADGKSFAAALDGIEMPGRSAVSEFYDMQDNRCLVGRMLHREHRKLICYDAYPEQDMLLDTEQDPEEEENLVSVEPGLYREMKAILDSSPVAPDNRADFRDCLLKHRILAQLGAKHPEWNPYTYIASEAVRDISSSCKRSGLKSTK